MAFLIFLGAILTVLIFLIRILIKAINHKRIGPSLKIVGIIIFCYISLWVLFYVRSGNKIVPLGTDICFDDWCATVTKIERSSELGNEKPQGQFIILHIRMSNHAKGIAQKPSEPRVHIKDEKGSSWAFSQKGQKAFNSLKGIQPTIDQRLELHQALETELVFDIPQEARKLYVLIEEGPFITKLLLQDDKQVFLIY